MGYAESEIAHLTMIATCATLRKKSSDLRSNKSPNSLLATIYAMGAADMAGLFEEVYRGKDPQTYVERVNAKFDGLADGSYVDG